MEDLLHSLAGSIYCLFALMLQDLELHHGNIYSAVEAQLTTDAYRLENGAEFRLLRLITSPQLIFVVLQAP